LKNLLQNVVPYSNIVFIFINGSNMSGRAAPSLSAEILFRIIKGSGGKMNRKLSILAVLALCLAVVSAACGKKDADIQKAVQDKLTADGVSGVTATVKDGVATLSGEVADITVKSKAETSAKGVDGVKSVTNNVTLKPLPTPTPPIADPALTGKVEENLRKAGCTGASVSVQNGKVTITGTVPAAKYTECIQVVNQSGVGSVDNQLQKAK
jgi:osmotically-inducible protein OsmY